MKDPKYAIARSETEWLGYTYENMGVRQRTRFLFSAVNRRALYLMTRVTGIVRYGLKRRKFVPSYDSGKQNTVISLTSTPARIRYIFPTLHSLTGQKKRADIIVLWLGSGKAYPERLISKIRAMGIRVNFREDIGPHTKYHYAFSEYGNDIVITVDDDIIYHEDMTRELLGTYRAHPDCVVARRVHKMRFDTGKKPLKYTEWIWDHKDSGEPSNELFATGVGGVLYPPSVMSSLHRGNTDFLKVCRSADDIWLKFCELSNGIRVCSVPGSRYFYDVINPRAQKTDLATMNVHAGRNDDMIRSCAEYFGIRDDLCERVLADG